MMKTYENKGIIVHVHNIYIYTYIIWTSSIVNYYMNICSKRQKRPHSLGHAVEVSVGGLGGEGICCHGLAVECN